MSQLKVGAVSYLNTKPLVYGLSERSDELELIYDLPSRLADRLADGKLDVALIPVIEAITNPTYTIVSDACIACRGPVWSVKLFSRVAPGQINSLALDEGSRTSAALARIILKQQYSVEPELETLPINRPWRDSKSDAVLVIGDRAMKPLGNNSSDLQEFQLEWDLGEQWSNWTELPFVFAVWAARPEVNLEYTESLLNEARDYGMQSVSQICREQAPIYHMDEQSCHRYLTENLHFRLGQMERAGLDQFFDYAKKQSIINQDLNLQFHDCQTT